MATLQNLLAVVSATVSDLESGPKWEKRWTMTVGADDIGISDEAVASVDFEDPDVAALKRSAEKAKEASRRAGEAAERLRSLI